MAIHSSVLAWRIPGMAVPGELPSVGSQSQTRLKWLSSSSSIRGTYQPGKFIFQCSIFLPFHTIHGVLKARILKWFSIPFSSAWKWKAKVKSLSCVQLSATLWTAAYQAPPSMGFSRQEYWSGVPLPSPLDNAFPCSSLFHLLVSSLLYLPTYM